MTKPPDKPTKGGARPGAGRKRKLPSEKKQQIILTMSPKIIEYLSSMPYGQAGAYVENLVQTDIDKTNDCTRID